MWVLFTNDKFKKLNSLKLLLNFEVIFLLLTVTTVTIYTNQITILMPKNIIATIVLLNVVYIFLNLWFYFINIYTHSTYTTSVQRFWKRTFTLFWVIEGFLFSIFLYLWLIAPQETGIFIDKYSQNSSFFYKNNESLTYLTLNLLLVLVNFNLILSKKTNEHYFFFWLIVCVLTISTLFLLEYRKFIQSLNFLSFYDNGKLKQTKVNYTKVDLINAGSEIENVHHLFLENELVQQEKFIKRTDLYFFHLICFLKFWHVVFIWATALLTYSKGLQKKTLSMDNISANNQNFIYLMFFFLLNSIFFFKKYTYFFLKWYYFWFYENYHLTNYVYNTINELAMLLIYDKFYTKIKI